MNRMPHDFGSPSKPIEKRQVFRMYNTLENLSSHSIDVRKIVPKHNNYRLQHVSRHLSLQLLKAVKPLKSARSILKVIFLVSPEKTHREVDLGSALLETRCLGTGAAAVDCSSVDARQGECSSLITSSI